MSRQDRPLFAGSARSGNPELTAITAGIVVVCALGVISSLGPTAARFVDWVFAVFAVTTVSALAVGAVRRELRIRRRLAAIKPLIPQETARRHPTRASATIGDRP